MKAYTDLEKSKKLAKILSVETADMWYEDVGLMIPRLGHIPKEHTNTETPAWSLTALLGVLPNYQLQTQDDGTGILCSCNGKFNIVTADNPIDVCVAMIEKLHEQNLL